MPHLNWLGIGLAALCAFASGGIWFGPKTFFPIWWRAMGRTELPRPEEFDARKLFGGTIAAILVQAVVLAIVLGAIRGNDADFGASSGLKWGLLIGAGVAAASSLSHRLFAGHGFKVWIIEVANDVLNFAMMGAILGHFR